MREYQAKITEGKVKVSLYNEENEPIGAVYIDPTDFNILRRIDEAHEKIPGYVKEAEGIANEDAGEETITQRIGEIDKEIRETLNYVFDYDVCSVVFRNRNALSVSGGKYFFERLLDAFVPVFEDIAKEEQAAAKARVEKYTRKYKK